MASRNRIPPTLEPYLRLPPEASLIVLTSTLGCSVNWLTARFVSSLLTTSAKHDGKALHDGKETSVVLVSWIRDAAFWKTELRRAAGVDVSKLAEGRKYAFVDCFTTLSTAKPDTLLMETEKLIARALAGLTQTDSSRVVLVLDSPDVLLALGHADAHELSRLVLKLRSLAFSAIVSCAADLPLVAAATTPQDAIPTPIEVETAAFVVQQAQGARLVLSARELDTGAARDVSGLLRITRGGSFYSLEEKENAVGAAREMEALYLVQRDGTAKVFERGAVSA